MSTIKIKQSVLTEYKVGFIISMNVTCSRHDMPENKIFIWHLATITHSLTFIIL